MNLNDTTLALAGGAMIGLAAAGWLVLTGKTAGVSGMLYGMVKPEPAERGWQASFLLGLLVGGIGLSLFWPQRLPELAADRLWLYAAAGALVGFGTRLGGGCTSGHGVCGIGRLSLRSIAGTCVFIAAGVAAVYLFRHVAGV
ncbi:MAG: YeeE/YedE family protein [Planctomycetes bacterium]|jgi:uncharacterized membrane protein YedE/YeeE|nr:YeeE/YedE family protein [Planctomycetota bacterium]MCL4731089.1 YeeE/YedE family protein [Planctomycetota bacterium]